MTIWAPDLADRSVPLYRAIADALARDVTGGRLTPGARLPTHRDLAYRLGVTVGTVSRAYAEAERRGLIGGEIGRGTFVRDPAASGVSDAEFSPDLAKRADGKPGGTDTGAGRAETAYPWPLHLIHGTAEAAELERLDLSLNYPLDAPLAEVLHAGLSGLLAQGAMLGSVARYQPANGMQSHREAGAAWLKRVGVNVDPGELLIVPGCQGGLAVAFLALCRPGDVVLHEALTWPGLRATAAQQGLRCAPVPVDEWGVVPDALDAACREHRPRLFYTMPTLHNPLGIVMPAERRRAVAEVAHRNGVTVVEDDVYGFLLDEPVPPLRSVLPEQTIYITSLSKSVSPGLRVGYLVPPPPLLPLLAGAIRSNFLMTSSVATAVASEAIVSGAAAEAADRQRQEARIRQRLARDILDGLDLQSHPAAFHGWLALPAPWRGDDFVAALLARGIAVTPGRAFGTGGSEGAGHVRLCLCAIADRQRLATALRIVADVARQTGAGKMPVV